MTYLYAIYGPNLIKLAGKVGRGLPVGHSYRLEREREITCILNIFYEFLNITRSNLFLINVIMKLQNMLNVTSFF